MSTLVNRIGFHDMGVWITSGYRQIFWNAFLIMAGCTIFTVGMKAVLVPMHFVSGGLVGVSLIIKYLVPSSDMGLVYFLLNIPLFVLGWMSVGHRFMFYSIFGMVFFSLVASLVDVSPLALHDPILAALLAGVICGVGGGIVLKSLGSAGGLDILAVYVTKTWGIRPGPVITAANVLVLLAGAYFVDLEKTLYSIIYVFTSSHIIDMILAGFNRRKSTLIISERSEEIAQEILHKVNRGVTFLKATGAFTGSERNVLLTVTSLTELGRLKELVFSIDPNAFVIINDTLEVLGNRHGSRRIY